MSVSVLIPLYNAESWIACCLQGVDHALPDGGEILVYDDASTDRGRALVETLKDSLRAPLVLRHNPGTQPVGPGVARNLLMQEAGCDFIAFVDADDTVLPPYFHRMMEAFDHETDFVRTGHIEQGASGLRVVPLPLLSLEDVDGARNLSPRDHIGPANRSTSVDVSQSWGGLYRRDFLAGAGIRFAETTHCEDRLFTWMTHLRGRAYKHLPAFHYVHRKGVGGITETFNDGVFGVFPAYRAIRDLPELNTPAFVEKLCRQFMAISLHHLKRAGRDPARAERLRDEIAAYFHQFNPPALAQVVAALTQKDRKRLSEVLALVPASVARDAADASAVP